MEPNEMRKEEIYLCKSCQFPLSYSSIEEKIIKKYGMNFLIKVSDGKIDLKKNKCIFVTELISNSLLKDYFYDINIKNEIICRICKHKIGFKVNIDRNIAGTPLIVGFLIKDEIDIKELYFQNLKDKIEVISMTQIKALESIKRLTYMAKEISPNLEKSMKNSLKLKRDIEECEDKLNKFKLNEIFNHIETIKKKNESKKIDTKEK